VNTPGTFRLRPCGKIRSRSKNGIANIWIMAGLLAAGVMGYMYLKNRDDSNSGPYYSDYSGNSTGGAAGDYYGNEQAYADPYGQDGYVDPYASDTWSGQEGSATDLGYDYGYDYGNDYGIDYLPSGADAQNPGTVANAPDSSSSLSLPLVDKSTFHKRFLKKFDEDGDAQLSDAERAHAKEDSLICLKMYLVVHRGEISEADEARPHRSRSQPITTFATGC